jgi:hypothetical protein
MAVPTKTPTEWVAGGAFFSERDVRRPQMHPAYWRGASAVWAGPAVSDFWWQPFRAWLEPPELSENRYGLTYAFSTFTPSSTSGRWWISFDPEEDAPELLVTASGGDVAESRWLAPTLTGVSRVLRVGDETISTARRQYVAQALEFLWTTLQADSAPPSLSPLNDGGVQVEWHGGGLDVEVLFSDDHEERGIYVRDKATNEEWEIPLEDAPLFVERFADRLTFS